MQTKHSGDTKQLKQKKKFLLVMPLLAYPFFTFMLYSLGFIGTVKAEERSLTRKGFNLNLPNPLPSGDSNWNKLKFYEEADKDSAKYKSLVKSDPNLVFHDTTPIGFSGENPVSIENHLQSRSPYSYDPYPSELQRYKDPNEAKVYKKLAQLDKELTVSTDPNPKKEPTASFENKSSITNTSDIDRLENMMQKMQDTDSEDPQLTQLNGMLQNILDIQHPERVRDRIKGQSEINRQQVFPVTVNQENNKISLLKLSKGNRLDTISLLRSISNRGFHNIITNKSDAQSQNAIRAVVPVTQKIVEGATVKLHLADDVFINGLHIPKGEPVFGVASLNGERIKIEISSIGYQSNILPVALSVYDLNGMEGIYMPGAITRDVAKQSSDQAIQQLSLATLDPSIGAQAASAGIQAAKTLIGRKAKLVKVTVRAGYEVLLRDVNKRD